MINENESHHHEHCNDHCSVSHNYRRICWSAILVGAFVAVGLGFLLHLYGVAIGLSVFSVSDDNATVIAYGGLIGMLLGVIASMLTAGYAAGYLGRFYCPHRNLGILYGFTTWAVALILGAVVASHMGEYASNYSAELSQSAPIGAKNTSDAMSKKSEASKKSVSVETSRMADKPTVNIDASAKTLTWGAFILFILFFIGAISSCIGACWGMSCKRND